MPDTAPALVEQPSQAHRRRRPQVTALVLVGVLGLVAVFGVVSETTILHPRLDAPAHADAIVVLGGRGDRMAVGLALLARGVAPVIVATDGSGADLDCAYARLHPTAICYRPEPYTTQGEARGFAALAKEHGWTSVVVVSSVDQASRARIRFDRCFDGQISMAAAPEPGGTAAFAFAYEWGALVKAETVQRGC